MSTTCLSRRGRSCGGRLGTLVWLGLMICVFFWGVHRCRKARRWWMFEVSCFGAAQVLLMSSVMSRSWNYRTLQSEHFNLQYRYMVGFDLVCACAPMSCSSPWCWKRGVWAARWCRTGSLPGSRCVRDHSDRAAAEPEASSWSHRLFKHKRYPVRHLLLSQTFTKASGETALPTFDCS